MNSDQSNLDAILERIPQNKRANFGVLGATERNAELGITFRCSQDPKVESSLY